MSNFDLASFLDNMELEDFDFKSSKSGSTTLGSVLEKAGLSIPDDLKL